MKKVLMLDNGAINNAYQYKYWGMVSSAGQGTSLNSATSIAINNFREMLEWDFPDADGAFNVKMEITSSYNALEYYTVYDVLVYGNPYQML